MVRTRETDDASEERRPRKKKKPPSQVGLWIGLGVGGGVLLILLIAGVVGVIIATRAGEPQAKAPLNLPPPPPPPQPVVQPEQEKFKDIGDKKRSTTGIRARADRPARMNELRQIALFYVQYRDTLNRPPKTVQDFTEYIKRDAPGIVQAIDEKYYVLVPNVRGDGIVAYERDPDQNNRHAVAHASTPVEEISTQELLAQLKAQGSQ